MDRYCFFSWILYGNESGKNDQELQRELENIQCFQEVDNTFIEVACNHKKYKIKKFEEKLNKAREKQNQLRNKKLEHKIEEIQKKIEKTKRCYSELSKTLQDNKRKKSEYMCLLQSKIQQLRREVEMRREFEGETDCSDSD